jgi:predicted Zn-dependent peptidase
MRHTVSEIKLKNGARGLLVNVPYASVMTLQISFRAGEYLVERDKWETPHLMEHLLLGANKQIPKARKFQAEFEKNGAYTNASTGVYDVTYEAECADFEWQRILGWMIVAITQPLFLDEEFASECGNVREEMSARANNHFRHLSLALSEAFGFCSISDQDRLQLMHNVTLKDIRDHYQATHTASNMKFVIAGRIPRNRRAHIKDIIENMDLPKGYGRKKLPKETPKRLKKPLVLKNRTVDNYYFYLETFLKRAMNEEEVDAMVLINSMLTETLYSKILGTAREKGLVYGMSSAIQPRVDSTNWWFGSQVRPDNAPALFDVITGELQKVFDGDISSEDLDAAKQYSFGKHQRYGQTVGGLLSAYAARYFYDDHINDYQAVPERIRAVTKTRIVEGANELFSQDIGGMGILGNPKKEEVRSLNNQFRVLWDRN